MTFAVLGYGSLFKTGDGNSPEAFTAFAEVAQIELGEIQADVIDTSHEMPPGSTRESFPGLSDYGEIQIVFNFIPGNSSADLLMTELETRPTKNRQVVYPGGAVLSFAGFLIAFDTNESVSDKLTGTATFKVKGGLQVSTGFFTIGVSIVGGLDIIA